jgi:hypothetical protein
MKKNRYTVQKGITTSDPAYSSGDQIATVLEIENAFVDGVGLKLESVSLIDKGDQKAPIDILFFDDEPIVSSADNSPVDISSTQLEKCIGILSLQSSDYKTIKASTNAIATKSNINLILKNKRALPNGASTLWVLLISRGSPDWTAGENLILKLGMEAN